MTENTRSGIETLGAKLKHYGWGLYDGGIRQAEIAGSDQTKELKLCPLATAIRCITSSRIERFLAEERHAEFRQEVQAETERISEQMTEADDDGESPTEAETTSCTAAAVINDGPVRTETERLLGLDTAAVKSIMNAADDPTSEEGRLLVRALCSPSNTLREEYQAQHGSMP